MQHPPASKPAPKSVPAHVPAHVLGGEPPMPPTMAQMHPPVAPMPPPAAPMPPGLGTQPPGAHGGYPGAPGPMNGHMGAQHHNDFGPARGKAGETNQPFTSFGNEFHQDPNKLKRPPKRYHTRVAKVQMGPDDYDDSDSSFDGRDSATSPEDDSSVSSFSDYKPQLPQGSLHHRRDRERIYRSHSRKPPPQKSGSANARLERSRYRRENRTYPSELVVIPGGGVNSCREQPTYHRGHRPITVLHTHPRPRPDYPSEQFYHRDSQERRDEHGLAREYELREELRELELRELELRQHLQDRDKLEEATRQQLRFDPYTYKDDPRYPRRTTSYREPHVLRDRRDREYPRGVYYR
jgi:hypothetical protein